MAEKRPQTLENHVRIHPLFHRFAFPILGGNVGYGLYRVYKNPGLDTGWQVAVALALMAIALLARMYAVKVQDRVIRLEERLRMQQLLPDRLKPRIPKLSEKQLVALRFASDQELAQLAELTLDKGLKPPEIKKEIKSWRADEFRV
ncbi:MAG: hypothetical protein HY235_19135 [Acidobacteria bacterium]|nr:hypothetical protein [Acidobacteriota bacterium]